MAHKILINSLDTATLVCPHCGQKSVIQVSEYKLSKEITRIKCRCLCGNTYPAILKKEIFLKKMSSFQGPIKGWARYSKTVE